MLEPESNAFWPNDVPFPLHLPRLLYAPFDADIAAELTEKFQYSSRFRSDPDLNIRWGIRYSMHTAATIGDIEFLDFLNSKYGGIEYERDYTNVALRNGHFEFYMYLLQLAKFSCILQISDDDSPSWATFRSDPLADLLRHDSITEENQYMLVRYLHENIILTYPSHEYMKRYLHTQGAYFPIPGEEYLISSVANYPRLTEDEIERPLVFSLVHEKLHRIRRYLIEEQGYHYTDFHLSRVTQRKRRYEYVLQHLEPGLDRDELQTEIPFQPLTDAELLDVIAYFFKRYLKCLNCITTRHEHEFELRNMAELWFDQPNLIPKIVFVINFLESNGFCDNDLKFVRELNSDAERQQTSPIEYARLMASYLRQVLDLTSRLGFEGFANIDWSVESPIDLAHY